MIFKNSVLRNLIILLTTFVIGFSTLILVRNLFSKFIDELNLQIENERARYKIGEYILKEVNELEIGFYKIALTFDKKNIIPIQDDIIDDIIEINKAIDVLEHGGKIKTKINLNLIEIDKFNEVIEFYPKNNNHFTYESITLRPKLASLEKKIYQIKYIVSLKQELLTYTSKEKIKEARFKIQLLYKQIPSIFIRMKESSASLLYESKKNLTTLLQNVEEKKTYYKNLEFFVSYTTLSIVIILSYLLAKMIAQKNKELEQISQKAEASALEASNANKIKSQFLANMSHEIRTPLNAIIGFSELLSKTSLNKENKDKAHIIVKSAKALLEIINDILDISKVESGKFEIQNDKFILKELLSQIVELYSINANKKNIRFVFDLDSEIPEVVKGDEIRLKQVLSNLLSNAIKFTSSNSKVIFIVNLKQLNDENATIKFIIKDEGIGISPSYQKKIFEPFSQADGSISRKFGGTGLGLAISLKIIQLMGSNIKLISKENEGSTFYFNLNLPIIEQKIEKKIEHKYHIFLDKFENDLEHTRKNIYNILKDFSFIYEDISEIPKDLKLDLIFCFNTNDSIFTAIDLNKKYKSPVVFVGPKEEFEKKSHISHIDYYHLDVPIYGSKVFNIVASACKIEESHSKTIKDENITLNAKILVAEDNLNNQLLIKLLLEELGIDVKIVTNGLEALNEYENAHYDMILMDINMPIMDGITSMKKIKRSKKFKINDIPIIALTANTIKGDKEKYIYEGMDDYLAKPIEHKKLTTILSKYLNQDTKLLTKTLKEEINENSIVENIAKTLGVSENIAKMVVDKFKSDIDLQLGKLDIYIRENDKEKIKQQAHYMKNSCLNVSLDEASNILQDMEIKPLSENDLEKSFKQLKEIIDIFITKVS